MVLARDPVLSIHSVTRTVSVACTTFGHEDVGVLGEGVREHLLGLRLEAVVELLGRALLELVDERADVDAREHGGDAPCHPSDPAQVAHQGLAGAGVLDLHGHVAAVLPASPVHLTDGGGRRGCAVQPDDLVLPVGAECVREDLADGLGRHRSGRSPGAR